MKQVLKIKRKKFINWFFYSGADQDQESGLVSFAQGIVTQLIEEDVTISAQSVLDNCEQTVIPLHLFEGFGKEDTACEIGDAVEDGRIDEDFVIELI